ncbi:MAG: flagellar motor protein MotB [Candidatus Korobacteraceae bacterium]
MANGPIIIKKVSGHGGHHGGAWKVAYADFVTAMMALFIVLWLLNSSKQVQEAVGGYFKDPTGNSKMVGSTMRGAGQNLDLRKEDMKKIKELLEKQVKSLPDFEKLKKHIDMTITAEGLRIELTEGESGTFFELGSAVPSSSGVELLKALAQEVGKLSNKVSVEGHTDSKPYSGGLSGYSNWELSVDRANAARRIMQSSGLQGNQVAQVRGFADQRPRVKGDAADPANRRISLIVQYLDTTPPDNTGEKAPDEGAANHSAESKNGEVEKK